MVSRNELVSELREKRITGHDLDNMSFYNALSAIDGNEEYMDLSRDLSKYNVSYKDRYPNDVPETCKFLLKHRIDLPCMLLAGTNLEDVIGLNDKNLHDYVMNVMLANVQNEKMKNVFANNVIFKRANDPTNPGINTIDIDYQYNSNSNHYSYYNSSNRYLVALAELAYKYSFVNKINNNFEDAKYMLTLNEFLGSDFNGSLKEFMKSNSDKLNDLFSTFTFKDYGEKVNETVLELFNNSREGKSEEVFNRDCVFIDADNKAKTTALHKLSKSFILSTEATSIKYSNGSGLNRIFDAYKKAPKGNTKEAEKVSKPYTNEEFYNDMYGIHCKLVLKQEKLYDFYNNKSDSDVMETVYGKPNINIIGQNILEAINNNIDLLTHDDYVSFLKVVASPRLLFVKNEKNRNSYPSGSEVMQTFSSIAEHQGEENAVKVVSLIGGILRERGNVAKYDVITLKMLVKAAEENQFDADLPEIFMSIYGF